MTNQEVFTKVTKHLLLQKKRSLLEDEYACAYRGANGLQCAIGCLIPDEVYQPEMERMSLRRLRNHSKFAPALTDLFQGVDKYLLDALQTIHDEFDPFDWKAKLEELAERWHLQMPEIEVSDD